MSYEMTGKVKLIQDIQKFESGFTKREMVVTVEDGNYPQDINLEFVQDKISLLENLHKGQEVTVSFNIKGREYNGRYFNNLQGWKIQVTASSQKPDVHAQPIENKPTVSKGPSSDFDDDIPF